MTMKKAAAFLVIVLVLSLFAGCGQERVSVDISDGGVLTSSAADNASLEDAGSTPQKEEGPKPDKEPEYVTLTSDGKTASATVDSVYLAEDGRLVVVLEGTGHTFDNTLPIQNGKIVVPFGVDVTIGDDVYSWKTASFETGKITYYIDAPELPEQIFLYSNDNKDGRFAFDAAPFITSAPLVVESAVEDEPAAPVFEGRWLGSGRPLNGGEEFTLRIIFREDAEPSCRVWLGAYSERFPVYFNENDRTVSADMPEDNSLYVVGCEGTYEFDGETLSLHVTAQITSGDTLEYEAELEKAPPAETVTDEPYTMVTSKFSVDGSYTGEWRDGKPNGTGVLTILETNQRWDTGDTLWSEDWVDGLIEGFGEWRSAVDGAYDGYFVAGLKEGYGIMWFSNGKVYDGRWSKGSFVG